MPPLPPPQPPKRSPRLFVAVGLVAVVAVAIVLALLLGGGDDDSVAGDSTIPASTVAGGVVPAESQPVEVSGEPLPALPTGGAADPAIGLVPPSLSGYSFDGSPVEISPGGGPTMVVFLAHWCPHCNNEVPRLLEWNESGRVPEGLEIVAVSTRVTSGAPHFPPSSWLADFGWPWPVLADSSDDTALDAYALPGFPYFVLIGADGEVKLRFSGEIEVEQLDSLVRGALAQG